MYDIIAMIWFYDVFIVNLLVKRSYQVCIICVMAAQL
jgi:hypothetical protein